MGRNRIVLLDTCALLWLVQDLTRFSKKVLAQIDEANVLYISAISGFEIGLKYKSGKLSLPATPEIWFEEVVRFYDLSILKLDMETCIKASQLPYIHKDPCDRFIIASALLKHLSIITADKRFTEYGISVIL